MLYLLKKLGKSHGYELIGALQEMDMLFRHGMEQLWPNKEDIRVKGRGRGTFTGMEWIVVLEQLSKTMAGFGMMQVYYSLKTKVS